MPAASIDLGSNSALLLVVDDDGRVLHDEARVVGLGRGLGDRGLFLPDRMKAAQEALGDYVRVAAGHGVKAWSIRAVATSAARRALNAETFFARVKRDLGLEVAIISGDEEARLTWIGARRDLDLGEADVLVVDLGGGSTELALGRGDEVARRRSLEIGSVRLTEQFLGDGLVDRADLARCRSWIDVALQRFTFTPAPAVVVGVAGTVTTLATMVLGLAEYDAARVHGSTLTRADLARCTERLLAAPDATARRALVPASPERADFLVAGAAILDRTLAAAGQSSLRVSDRGLRFALV